MPDLKFNDVFHGMELQNINEQEARIFSSSGTDKNGEISPLILNINKFRN